MLEEYRDCFDVPSEADMVIAEAQEKLRDLFNDVTKATCERARNAELELSRLQGKITAAQYKLEAVKRAEDDVRQRMERYEHHDFPLKVVQDIMRELTLDFCPGDKAYIVSLTKAEKPCEYCGGEGQFEATASGVSPKLIKCPKCEGRKKTAYAVNKAVEVTVAAVHPSIMFNTKGIRIWKDDCIITDDNGYYSANEIFKTLEEAQAKADKLNGNRG